jgi:type I restriction enzyme S subunit
VSTVWEENLLGDLIVFKNGKRIENTDYDDNGLNPVYGSNGIIGRTNKRNVVGESIIVGRVGAYCGSLQYSNHSAWITDNAIYGVVKPGNDTRFLYYLMNTIPIREFAGGSAQPLINQTILNNISVNVPNLKIQRRIADILGSLDDKIELNRRMNETLEQMAMALYKHWFVDFGPFQDGEFMESEIGPIPINWELRSLYSLANYINGMAFKQRDLNDQKEGLPVIKISELNADSPKSAKYYAGPYQDKYFLNTGDVLFSWSATLDIYLWSHGPALLNQHIFNVKSNGSFSKSTLYFILKSVINEFKEIAASRATTMGHIKKEHLEEKLIPYPPAEVRVKIESQFANYFDLMLSNLLEINTLAETRDYLLPRLLSGEIEVREAEEQVEEVLANA